MITGIHDQHHACTNKPGLHLRLAMVWIGYSGCCEAPMDDLVSSPGLCRIHLGHFAPFEDPKFFAGRLLAAFAPAKSKL